MLVTNLSDSQRATAVSEFNNRFGEMDRALWCLSTNCRSDLLGRRTSRVVEEFVWTVKSWWGVQGVRSQTKQLMAQALAAMNWSTDLFEEASRPPNGAVRFASDRVSELVTGSMSLGVTRREFSLASKVLHWLMPWRIPVYDSFVREQLRVPTSWDHPRAYRKIAEDLFRAAGDLESLDKTWLGVIEPRSLLRGIDKCLWWLGGGNQGKAAVVRDPWRVVCQLGLRPS